MNASEPATIPMRQALLFWLKLGFISFGGPAGQISIMHQELVERRRWISEARFLHALNYCMLLPGPEAQQLATYIGWLMHRTAGALLAGLLFIMPSLLLMIGLAWLYVSFGDTSLLAGMLYGAKPAVTAIVLQAALRMGRRTLHNGWLALIALAAFVGISLLGLPFPLIILGAAGLGFIGGRLRPAAFRLGGARAQAQTHGGRWVIDDATPTPDHARFRRGRLLRLCAIGALLWLLPMLALGFGFGWGGELARIGWFFSKVAVLSFGGAYAVLPYVYQGAVEHYGWLSAAQMIDGLALGETTPGPLIMLVAFVGFLGAHNLEALGPGPALLAGVIGALIATWFTFLPSFLFILGGGPLVESTRGRLAFSAPLTGITAAVVGVICSLALLFGYQVFWPEGLGHGFEWPALLIAIGAATALLYGRRSVIEVIIACGLTGTALQALGWTGAL